MKFLIFVATLLLSGAIVIGRRKADRQKGPSSTQDDVGNKQRNFLTRFRKSRIYIFVEIVAVILTVVTGTYWLWPVPPTIVSGDTEGISSPIFHFTVKNDNK